jgi:hypothetical protein
MLQKLECQKTSITLTLYNNNLFIVYFQGFAFPAMHGLLASWAPPDEKSKLASIVYAGKK